MAENTRARSAERANLSAEGPSAATATTASRERTTVDLTSKFNFFVEKLRSAVERPDSITVDVAGPFDPIGIPDDVNETHAALISHPDSVSIEELGRCLKVVTDLSKKRKDDMLKTIAETVNAERDAYLRAKFAESDEKPCTRCCKHATPNMQSGCGRVTKNKLSGCGCARKNRLCKFEGAPKHRTQKLLSSLKQSMLKRLIPVLPLAP